MSNSAAISTRYYVPLSGWVSSFLPSEKLASIWRRCKSLVYAPSPLAQRVRAFAQNSNQIQAVIDALASQEFPELKSLLRQGLESARNEDVHEAFEQLFLSQVDQDPMILVRRLQEVMTLEKIEAVVRSKFPHFTSTLEVAGKISQMEAEEYAKRMVAARDTLKQTLTVYCINSFEYVVNMLMYVFHVRQQSADASQWEAQFFAEAQYRAFRENIVLISGWTVALSLYTQSAWKTAVITTASITSVIALIYAYLKWLKPCPDQLPFATNLVTEAKMGRLSPVYGRDPEIDRVIQALCANGSSTREHPLLIGETGVGKTEIVKGLALRIAQGRVPDELKGKKLFWINTAYLGGKTFGTSNLDMLRRAAAGYEADAIFFFDELQSAFNEGENVGQKLKTLMDPGQTNFKYIIAATTTKEYEACIRDEAFIRRINPIKVKSTSEETTLALLRETARFQAPEIIVENEALEALSKLKGVSQPSKSMTLLAQAIASLRTPQFSQKKKDLQRLKNQRDIFRSKRSTSIFSEEGLKHFQEFQEIEKKIHALEKEIDTLENQIAQFQAVVRKQSEAKELANLSAIQITKDVEKGVCREESLKTFLLSYHFLRNALAAWIAAKKETFPVPVVLNLDFVKKVMLSECSYIA